LGDSVADCGAAIPVYADYYRPILSLIADVTVVAGHLSEVFICLGAPVWIAVFAQPDLKGGYRARPNGFLMLRRLP